MRRIFIFVVSLCCLLISLPLNGQISQGGMPPSLAEVFKLKSTIPVVEVPIDFNVEQLRVEDEYDVANGMRTRLGVVIPVSIDLLNIGRWETLANGSRVCKLNVYLPGALATSFYFDKFQIPSGGKLFIYNGEKKHVLGAYTNRNNSPQGAVFSTEYVAGDFITLEYVEPETSNSNDILQISISDVGYGYNHIKVWENNDALLRSGYGSSYACMVDINCSPEGDDWQNQKKGVAKMLYKLKDNYQYFCTGTLLNNTAEDGTPYWLTANHCFGSLIGEQTFSGMVFYFHYEEPGCGRNPLGEFGLNGRFKTLSGSELLVNLPLDGGSDQVLMRLTSSVPNDYDLFWNGWDRREIAPQSGVCIHHPDFDVKKISTFYDPANSATWNNQQGRGALNAHWQLRFSETPNGFSVTQGGSSGSPLFNQEGRVAGTLTGGNTYCGFPEGKNYYGKLSWSWNKPGAISGKTIAEYLDPGNTGKEFVNGRYRSGENVANFTSDRELTGLYASEYVRFINNSFGADTYYWELPGGTPAVSEERNPVVCYNMPGAYDVTLIINKGTANEKQITKQNYIQCIAKTIDCDNDVIIGTGTGVSAYPLGYTKNVLLDASLYTSSELNNTAGVIYKLAWKTNIANPEPQTVIIRIAETDETALSAARTWVNDTVKSVLVYQGSSVPWINNDGWITFKLDKPFKYSGAKNLKIYVKTVSKTDSDNGVYTYSVINNSHAQWSSETTSGTVNNNRPNIKVVFADPCPVTVPIASFTPEEKTYVLKETFDSDEMFSQPGWQVVRQGQSSNVWKQGNYGFNFNTIDPASKYSALILVDLSSKVKSYIQSPKVTVPTHAILDFYMAYDGLYLGSQSGTVVEDLIFQVSENKGTDWKTLWTPGKIKSNLPTRWEKETIDLAPYAGKEIMLRWTYEGKGGSAAAIDNVSLYTITNKERKVINEGDSIRFTDLSQGPVVSWEWTFPGGTPATSKEQHPVVYYTTSGEYDVVLKVRNHQGEDTKTITQSVTVNQQSPVCSFTAEGGYKRKTNYGRFIPTGANINIIDNSANYPRQWAWQLSGSNKESSDQKIVPMVTYNTPGKYPVQLSVTNDKGSSTKEMADYILVSGTDSIWNMPDMDPGESVYERPTGGYITGSNKLLQNVVVAYSERFNAPLRPGHISQVAIQFHVNSRASSSSIPVSIYEDKGGVPGSLIAKTTLDVMNINPDGYTNIPFPEPVGISTAFHVVVEGFYQNNTTYNIAIKSSSTKSENGTGTACGLLSEKATIDWYPLSYILPYNLSLNIVPLFTYSELDLSNTVIEESNAGNNLHSIDVTCNVDWKVSTLNIWIDARKSGNTLTVKMLPNTGLERKGMITVSAGGVEKHIFVRQAGIQPENLQAKISTLNPLHVELNWNAPEPKTESYYYDDVENHNPFVINSSGAVGWSFVDGDKSATFSFSGITFPNHNKEMAFISFNPYLTTPACDESMAPHSGSQYFACFNANSKQTDDWIISPELSFEKEFIFSFWAKSREITYGPERIRVAYSTTGKTVADFTHVLTTEPYATVPATWTKYYFKVPADAKFVAVNCVSDQAYILLLDDLYIGIDDLSTDPKAAALKSTQSALTPATDSKLYERTSAETRSNKTILLNSILKSSQTVSGIHSASKASKAALADGELLKLRWDKGENFEGLGLDYPGSFETAILFTPDELVPFHGCEFTAVEFYPHLLSGKTGTASYEIKIRQDGKLICSLQVPHVTFNEFNVVQLSTPIKINASLPLQIGYKVTDEGGKFPAGYDYGPGYKNQGDLVSTDGGFSFYSLSDMGLSVNWNMAAIVSDNRKKDIAYKIYRNGAEIATSSNLNYMDENLALGDYCYNISAVYGNDLESGQSAEACITVTGISAIHAPVFDQIKVYPNPVKNKQAVYVQSALSMEENQNASIILCDLTGKVLKVLSVSGEITPIEMPYEAGNYILQVKIGKATKEFKLTVQ